MIRQEIFEHSFFLIRIKIEILPHTAPFIISEKLLFTLMGFPMGYINSNPVGEEPLTGARVIKLSSSISAEFCMVGISCEDPQGRTS
jgi:hypothetical protein